LQQVERLKVALARQQLDQARQEHRVQTLAQTRPDLSARQVRVLQEECRRLEARMDCLERQLSPLQERLDVLARQYQEKLDALEDCKRAMRSSDLRQKGAAVARFFDKVILRFRAERRGKRVYGQWVGTTFLLNPAEEKNPWCMVSMSEEALKALSATPDASPLTSVGVPAGGSCKIRGLADLPGEEYKSGGTAGPPP
jgi:hypothetical protein